MGTFASARRKRAEHAGITVAMLVTKSGDPYFEYDKGGLRKLL